MGHTSCNLSQGQPVIAFCVSELTGPSGYSKTTLGYTPKITVTKGSWPKRHMTLATKLAVIAGYLRKLRSICLFSH